MKNNKRVLAFDIGGTKIASGIIEFSQKGYKIFDYQKNITPKNKKDVIQKLVELIVDYKKDNNFEKIGIGIAGQIDYKNDKIIHTPNINGFDNLNLKKKIKEMIGEDVEIENDVKCFALAENVFGRVKNYHNIVYLAIGTGIGGAIEFDNKLYRGENNIAGEFGHMIIVENGKKCSCGNRGCLEQYVSGRAIEKLYFEFYGKRKKAKEIAIDSAKGIKKDKKVIKQTSHYFAIGLVNIINTINPEVILVGGSVVKQDEILQLAKKEALKRALIPGRKTKILKSRLGNEATLVGAGLL
ncbi:MAG: ROK family protein [Candidatus Pacebacteria bacterium]|nr:ROK family protein [Candidatus Paceibacterota bacterium]